MTTPTITLYPDTLPAKGQANDAFDVNVNDFLDWLTLTNGPELQTLVTYTSDVVNSVLATALAGDLPALTGKAGDYIRANAAEDGGEFRTPAQVLSDIGLATTDSLTLDTLTLSGGVKLGGTAASNLLDDYEEGTFTPAVVYGTVNASARYTKVGNKVTVWGSLSNFSDRTTSVTISMSGLPFAPANAGLAGTSLGTFINNVQITAVNVVSEAFTFVLTSASSGGNTIALQHANLTISSSAVKFTATYETAA